MKSFVILGAGVSGLTTGVVLLLHGHKVRIVSDQGLPGFTGNDAPEYATPHAAASVLPHSVNAPDVKRLTRLSQEFFHYLAFAASFGVRVQRHYELFEKHQGLPEFARELRSFKRLLADGTSWVDDHSIPRRGGASEVFGWYFDAFFCEAPTYVRRLFDLFRACGGELNIVGRKLDLEEFLAEEGDVFVNCSGYGSRSLFREDSGLKYIRGHMIKVQIFEVPTDTEGRYFSYNYHVDPKTDLYPAPSGDDGEARSSDVYFYPRSDCWLLGGSRQEEVLGSEEWVGSLEPERMMQKRSWEHPVPRPAWELNRELIESITGVDVARYKSSSYIGYRLHRTPEIRVETETVEVGGSEKLLVHNYGHGGAGYTLSWGCALRVIELVEESCAAAGGSLEPNWRMQASRQGEQSLIMVLVDLCRSKWQERQLNVSYVGAEDAEIPLSELMEGGV